MAHCPWDAKPNDCPGGDLQSPVCRVDLGALFLRLVETVRGTAARSAGRYRVGIDPRPDLPCGGGGRHLGPTCETTHRQEHHRRGLVSAAGAVADRGVRSVADDHAPTQGGAGPPSARSRRGRAAFPKVGVAVLLELGLPNPLAAALGSQGESGTCAPPARVCKATPL